jgi:RND superfamily putative drug exporter
MAVIAAILNTRKKNTESVDSISARVKRERVEAPPTPEVLRIAKVTRSTVNGYTVLRVVPTEAVNSTTEPELAIVYLHGGAYTGPMINPHWSIIAALVKRTGATVVVPQYGLAPEHTYRDAYELIDSVYASVSAAQVFLMGDSAGGALAIGEAMRIRDAGGRAPAGLILFSPWVDATMSNPEIPRLLPRDPMLGPVGLEVAGEWWAGDDDSRTPLVSPLFGNPADLPPMHIYQGGRDILAADAKLFAAKVAAAGGEADLQFYPNAIHVWVGVPWVPEAKRALSDVAAVLLGMPRGARNR